MEVGFEIDLRARKSSRAPQVIAGLILAAGASERMGTPKALLDYQGETFVDRLIQVLGNVCESVTVVTGFHDTAIRGGIRTHAMFVRNPEPERGMLSSLQCGVRALPSDVSAVMFTTVDYPAVLESTVAAIAENLRPGIRVVQPVFQDRRGHPVLIDRGVAYEILELPVIAQARDVIRRHADSAVYIRTDDPGVIDDIDRPADYLRLVGRSS